MSLDYSYFTYEVGIRIVKLKSLRPVGAGGSKMDLRCPYSGGCSYQYPLGPLVHGVFLSLIFKYPMTEFCKT